MPKIIKILVKNNSGAEVFIDDLGISIPDSSERDLIIEFDLEELNKSEDLQNHVSSGDLIINDGLNDLDIPTALAHLAVESEWSDYEPGAPVVDSTTGMPAFEDPVSGETLGLEVIEIPCGRHNSTVKNQYLRTVGGIPMNITGVPLPYNATLVYFTVSNGKDTESWTAQVRKNGNTTIEDSLGLDNAWENHSIIQNENFYEGDRIQVYLNGTGTYPLVRLYFRRRY